MMVFIVNPLPSMLNGGTHNDNEGEQLPLSICHGYHPGQLITLVFGMPIWYPIATFLSNWSQNLPVLLLIFFPCILGFD